MESVVVPADMVETGARMREKRISTGEMTEIEMLRIFSEITDGRVHALEDLYARVGSRLYGLALWRTGSPEDAADVVQGVFVYVAENRRRLSAVRSPERWLMTLAHRRSIDLVRSRQRRQQVSLAEAFFLEAPEEDHSRSIDAGRVSTLLGLIPPEQREVIFLRHFEDCSFKAIGQIVGIPTFTAASRYRLGIKKLGRLLGEVDEK